MLVKFNVVFFICITDVCSFMSSFLYLKDQCTFSFDDAVVVCFSDRFINIISLKETRVETSFGIGAKKLRWEQRRDARRWRRTDISFSKLCLYNKKHDIVAIWQKDFGTFCFSVDYFCQSRSLFMKARMEIKCFRVCYMIYSLCV